jgi:predicted DNA-binding protein (MmcQ/YjbR family)
MTLAFVNQVAGSLPGTDVSDPFGGGHDVWKVGGKIFAIASHTSDQVSVKTDSIETAAMLIEIGAGTKAPYLHRSWIALPYDTEPGELAGRIERSYQTIRASLPKKLQAALGD